MDHSRDDKHPRAFEPTVFILNIVLAVLGAIIGMQIITTLGVTPNTALIGVLVAIGLSRLPGSIFSRYRSIHRQNLAQSNISCSTFAPPIRCCYPSAYPIYLACLI